MDRGKLDFVVCWKKIRGATSNLNLLRKESMCRPLKPIYPNIAFSCKILSEASSLKAPYRGYFGRLSQFMPLRKYTADNTTRGMNETLLLHAHKTSEGVRNLDEWERQIARQRAVSL